MEFIDLLRVATDGKDARSYGRGIGRCRFGTIDTLSRKNGISDPSPAKRGQRMVPFPLWPVPKLAPYVAVFGLGVSDPALRNAVRSFRLSWPTQARCGGPDGAMRN
jgi:hypothetical protein